MGLKNEKTADICRHYLKKKIIFTFGRFIYKYKRFIVDLYSKIKRNIYSGLVLIEVEIHGFSRILIYFI